ncbi:glycosyltransferase family 4 protein [Microbacterium sp. C7(2022)]|uniref:glycosyltransferase family 4 protein n=1 Tax=Microbacterium sp. C7(2022) TaxID=2992759 RepID=UPI00237AA0D1|nr:glycosyltransferase family 4 protein [Microbacterium sp. C7(2022)]MDE0545394.1 glycosyltransferase family 4 protein [Microbacterium sp. C7(2022)]
MTLSNAGLIDTVTAEPRITAGAPSVVLGHLSNLTQEKGIREVVDLAVDLRRAGREVELIVAGPIVNHQAGEQIARAQLALGANFRYLGAVYGADKRDFFGRLTHFVFPSTYKNEAAPLVVLEAMGAGIPVAAYDVGTLHEMLSPSDLLVPVHQDFVSAVSAWADQLDWAEAHAASIAKFEEMTSAYNDEIIGVVSALVGPSQ